MPDIVYRKCDVIYERTCVLTLQAFFFYIFQRLCQISRPRKREREKRAGNIGGNIWGVLVNLLYFVTQYGIVIWQYISTCKKYWWALSWWLQRQDHQNCPVQFPANFSSYIYIKAVCYCTHQEQALYGGTPVLYILWLVLKEVGYHLREQRSVPLSVEDTEVKDLGNVKEIVVVDDATMDLRAQVVLLYE